MILQWVTIRDLALSMASKRCSPCSVMHTAPLSLSRTRASRWDLRILLNTVLSAATDNHLKSESGMKPIYYYPCSDPKLSKTEAQKEKVICPRSYSKTLGELGLLWTHKATSLYITREETLLTPNITRAWKKFKFSPRPRKVSLYIH